MTFAASELASAQIAVPVYALGFIQTTAAQREEWGRFHRDARHLVPALLRRLVLTTGDALAKVDLPAFDNAEPPDGPTSGGNLAAALVITALR